MLSLRHVMARFQGSNGRFRSDVHAVMCAGRVVCVHALCLDLLSLNTSRERECVCARILLPRTHHQVHADVLCWLDVEGGLSAGADHVKQMVDGVMKAHVVVIFLSDAYVLSENCRREYETAVQHSKYILPILIPSWNAKQV